MNIETEQIRVGSHFPICLDIHEFNQNSVLCANIPTPMPEKLVIELRKDSFGEISLFIRERDNDDILPYRWKDSEVLWSNAQ